MDLTQHLHDALSTVDRPAEFAVAGTIQTPMPDLDVERVGPIAFPLLPVQAEQLARHAAAAPYGRGPDTIVDEGVRKTWQISPSQMRLGVEPWQSTLASIVQEAGRRLGVENARAELYKLLVYEEGGFFAEHRDSEKADGMFATLVVTLPARWTGGELVVRHAGREVELDLQVETASRVAWGAFFTDCTHELRPVTSGHRICLVYNLIRPDGALRAPDHSAATGEIATLLQAWNSDLDKVLYVLDHGYTPAELRFSRLKGRDAGVASVLRAATEAAECDVHLAMISIEESGAAEEVYQRYSRYSRYQDPEFEAGEVYDRRQNVEHWRAEDGSEPPFGRMPFAMRELSPPGVLVDEPPDEEHFWEATGNEGASFERTYRRAALVIWARARVARVVASSGPASSVAVLEGLEPGSYARELARAIVHRWPDRDPRSYGDSEHGKRLLETLLRLEDARALSLFVDSVVRPRGVRKEEAEPLAAAAVLLEERRFHDLAEALAQQCQRELEPPARFLSGIAAIPSRRDLAELVASRLVDSMPTEPRVHWRPTVSPTALRYLFDALVTLESPTLAETAATQISAQPHVYDLDDVVVPALIELAGSRGPELVRQHLATLWMTAVSHLEQRTKRPLGDPDDWSLDLALECKCENCQKLQAFVRSATERELRIRAAKAERKHLHNIITRHDLTSSTIRTGRPFTWVCNKNATAYQRRREQHDRDVAALAKLGVSPSA